MTDNGLPECVWPEWKFKKQIGRGSYGTVYEAVRLDEFQVESHAAIKVISIPQDESELDTLRTEGLDYNASKSYMRNVVDAFVNEIKMMIAFKGTQNIVSVEDYKVVEKQNGIGWNISIRMELLTPLYAYISDKTMTEKEVAKLGCDICSALEICDKKNVIHRDIKPGNIFVSDFGDFKLGDFGIAKQMEGMTTDRSRKGTGSYMAPEVEKGESYSKTVDLYSLGLVLYFLLNKNRLPFLDPHKQILTPNERERAIRRRLDGEALPAPCEASPKMSGIILCACAYDPQKRFVSASAMKNALQSVINGEGSSRQNISSQANPAPAAPKAAAVVSPAEAEKTIPPKQEESPAASSGKKKKRRIWILVVCLAAAAVVCIYMGVHATRVNQYDDLVLQQEEARENGQADEEEYLYEQASALLPSRLESYYQHAAMLHEQMTEEGTPDYIGCIDFIEEDILNNRRVSLKQKGMADVYYLYADSLFQSGEYSSAVDAYEDLFDVGTENAVYCRDYAIALAYTGHYTKAEDMLTEAEDLGLSEDSLYYTRGEVEKEEGDYEAALEDFAHCIYVSSDEEMIARAYLATADTYEAEGNPEEARKALLTAKAYDSTKKPQILQNLVKIDIELADEAGDNESTASGYRQEAIDTLKLVEENGWETFTTYNNMVVLYQQDGQLDEAEKVLRSVEEKYSSNYRWYMRLAFLEVAKQEERDIEDRSYAEFASAYNKARELYTTYLSEGGIADNEMGVLDRQYEEVKNSGWLS